MDKIRTHSLVDGTARINLRLAKNIIEDMPSIDIEPKRERCDYCKDGDFMGQRIMLGNDGKWHKINYCPNCGAKMKGADDE